MNPGFVIRPLDLAEVGAAVDWAAEEGWNPGLDDAVAFRVVDANGFLGLFADGVMVASVSAMIYDASFAFIGFYICRKDMRGRGHGRRLFDAALARLGNRTVGLDGVLAQQANYAAHGFALAHRNIRYSGFPSVTAPPSPSIVEVGEGPAGLVDAIVDYDRRFFPVRRDAFARQWISGASTRRTVAFVARQSVRGYGTVRACREGFKVGPLFADGAEIAEAIFAALVAPYPGARIMFDVPQPNAAACHLAERFRMSPTFETARMYRNGSPAMPLLGIFGITSFELG